MLYIIKALDLAEHMVAQSKFTTDGNQWPSLLVMKNTNRYINEIIDYAMH